MIHLININSSHSYGVGSSWKLLGKWIEFYIPIELKKSQQDPCFLFSKIYKWSLTSTSNEVKQIMFTYFHRLT